MREELQALKEQALAELGAVTTPDELKDLRIKYLGKRPDDRNSARYGRTAGRGKTENRTNRQRSKSALKRLSMPKPRF